ncbi:dTDP-4-dehydrorhamnose reductase [Sulfurospirillum sp.]|uniref:dTDP-4-dehydrorhamnose reductase n=1 Tax=Sulfurospirillum sp. TaxID=2053622 RepID=UPI002FDEC482
MLNILVTGANGQVGSELKAISKTYPYNFYFTDKANFDISDEITIKKYLETYCIDVIINCAAYTAVDKAETDIANADKINHYAVHLLASCAKEKMIKLIHLSTDYVFDGKSYLPYTETDNVSPQSVYGSTKLAGEKALQKLNVPNSIIIRTSWVYSSYGNNFVKTMLRLGKEKKSLGVIYDQVGSPTYAHDLAETILEIVPQINTNETAVFHYSNEGVCSWYDFAKEIMSIMNLECKINPIETFQYPTPAKRPHYSLLNKSKIKNNFNIEIPFWKDSLAQCLRKL